ncbi:MAG: hypothetical protein AAF850_12400 [Pseudomonadota bacterium]
MLSVESVDIPPRVRARLEASSAFVDNVTEFAREDLVGFRRPLAAAFALTAPIVLAMVYDTFGLTPTFKLASCYSIVAVAGLYLVGRNMWPELVAQFEARTEEKRRAVADLKCGFSELSFLVLSRPPYFIAHKFGVLVFVDAGDFRTLFLSIANDGTDPRWRLYKSGELSRRIWRWLRLPVSRELVRFRTEGTKVKARGSAPMIKSIDAWEAINLAIGEPIDGAIIHRPFEDVVDAVQALLD